MPPESKWEFLEGEDLALNLESGIYYMSKAMKGIPNIFRSTGQKDKRKAKGQFTRIIKEHLDRYEAGARAPGKSPTVAEVIHEIGPIEDPKLRENTRKKRKFYFARIRDVYDLGSIPIDRLTLPLWMGRLLRVQALPAPKKGKHRKTFKDDQKHANILLRYAYEQKYVSHWITFPNPDRPTPERIVFTIDEIRQLWAVMNEDTRDQFVLSYESCMRLREMLHLTWERVNLGTGEITLRPIDVKTGSKTGRGRRFIMTPHALARIKKRKAEQEPASLWVFPSPTGRGPVDDNKTAWNNAKAAVLEGDEKRGLPANSAFQYGGTWHDLRHTAITRLLVEQRINITLVSEYVGTAVGTLQRVYLHSTAEQTKSVALGLDITKADSFFHKCPEEK